MQQAIQSDLAFQRSERLLVERELENSAIACLLMPCQPGFTMAADAEFFGQLPLRPPRRTVADAQIERIDGRRSAMLHAQRVGKAVTEAMDRLDQVMIDVTHGAADLANAARDRRLGEDPARPQAFGELGLGDDLAGVKDEVMESFERLAFERNLFAVDAQFHRALIQNGVPELEAPAARLGRRRLSVAARCIAAGWSPLSQGRPPARISSGILLESVKILALVGPNMGPLMPSLHNNKKRDKKKKKGPPRFNRLPPNLFKGGCNALSSRRLPWSSRRSFLIQ